MRPLLFRSSDRTYQRMIVASILMLVVGSYCYALQGNWSLVSASGVAIGSQKVVLGITDFISPQQQILQQLTFNGCGQLQQQAEFSEGQVFLSSNSALTKSACDQPDLLSQLALQLGSVFFFQLNIDQLLFNDPYGSTVMSFQRFLQATPVNLTGIWTMNQYANTMTSLSVQFSPTQITLCQGNLVLNYTLYPSANIITLAPVLNKCPSLDLTAAVQSSKYFRVNNGILDLYDKSVSLTTELVYSMAYDPAKPLFASQVAAPQTASLTSPLAGTWAIAALFNIPFPSTSYSLTFNPTSISLLGGCNNYSFFYSINATSQTISIGNSTSSTPSCGQSDDQLFVSGIQKMYKYVLTKSAASALSFYDQQGNIGYVLKTAVPSAPTPASVTQSPLSSGAYLFLLLKRRDLPRMLVTISANSITYQGCNTIKHTFSPPPLPLKTGQISITGGPTTTNTCSINNDQIYIQALNQAKSYTFDPNAGTVIFSDLSGSDLVTFSASSK